MSGGMEESSRIAKKAKKMKCSDCDCKITEITAEDCMEMRDYELMAAIITRLNSLIKMVNRL